MSFRPNQSSDSASSSQIFTAIKLQSDSSARKMFDNELSRISLNLKSGHIADQHLHPPVFHYRNELNHQEPEVAQFNVAAQRQSFVNLHNQALYDQQKKENIQKIKLPNDSDILHSQNTYQNQQNFQNIKLPIDSFRVQVQTMNHKQQNVQNIKLPSDSDILRTQNMHQKQQNFQRIKLTSDSIRVQIQNMNHKQHNIQNIKLPSISNRVIVQNMHQSLQLPNVENKDIHNVQLPEYAAKPPQIANRLNVLPPKVQTRWSQKVVHKNARMQRNHAGLLPQFTHPSADQQK
jgi:hypothetical protein